MSNLELIRCYWCGNLGTEDAPLAWLRERGIVPRVVHYSGPCEDAVDADGKRVYPDAQSSIPQCGHETCSVDWDPCPPIRDDYGTCFRCLWARPLTDLTYTLPRKAEPGTGVLGEGWTLSRLNIRADTYPDREVAVYPRGDPMLLCYRGGCADPATRGDKKFTARRVDRNEPRQEDKDDELVAAVPSDGAGMSIAALMSVWNRKERSARNLVARLLADGALRFDEVATTSGGARRKVYWRVDR
jgi:hypothetical protein